MPEVLSSACSDASVGLPVTLTKIAVKLHNIVVVLGSTCLILVQALVNSSYFWHWLLSAMQILGVLLGIFDPCCLSLLGVAFFLFRAAPISLPTIPHYRVALLLLPARF